MEKRIYRGSIGDVLKVSKTDKNQIYLLSFRPEDEEGSPNIVCLEKKDAISLSIFLAELANQLPDND